MTTLIGISLTGSIAWLLAWLLPFGQFRVRHTLCADAPSTPADLSDITVVIPARDEAATLPATLAGLAAQGRHLQIIVVDDQSSDGTGALARSHPAGPRVIPGAPRPAGWLGKVWALEQGTREVTTPFILLLDADIALRPGLLPALRRRLIDADLGMASLMAELRLACFWERLLAPAYVYFFRLLYPFGLVERPGIPVAAAAGGCVLLRRDALAGIGGFHGMRSAIIDDCSLARLIKASGRRIWLGLTRDVLSLRPYERLADFWSLVSRSAYAELNFSPLRLAGCTAGLLLVYGGPAYALLAGAGLVRWIGLSGMMAMLAGYVPVLRYYGLSPLRALALPLVAAGYLLMTWHSALRYWRGTRTVWKGRTYSSGPEGLES